MRPSEIEQMLKRAIATPGHPPVFLSGPPGVGKSSVVRSVAAETNRKLIDIRAVLLDPIDIRGIVVPQGGKAVWLPPIFLPDSESTEPWILFFDELNLAPISTQHACYQLVLDRRVGEYVLPKDVFVVAAGNRVEDRAGVREIPAPLMNRFDYLPFDVHVPDWATWALKNSVSADIIAFIQLNSDLLFKFDSTRDLGPFPTPRSVVFADIIWKAHTGTDYVFSAMEGVVGKEWTAKFNSYLKIYKELPDIDSILSGKNTVIPTRVDLRYAVAALLGTKAKVEHLEAVLRYATRFQTEHGVFLIQLLSRRSELIAPLVQTPAWKEWIKQHSEFASV